MATETLPRALVASSQHLHALFDGEERILDRVDEDGDGEVVKELGAALDQVHVAVGGRVEGAGIEGFNGHGGLKGILAAPPGGIRPAPDSQVPRLGRGAVWQAGG